MLSLSPRPLPFHYVLHKKPCERMWTRLPRICIPPHSWNSGLLSKSHLVDNLVERTQDKKLNLGLQFDCSQIFEIVFSYRQTYCRKMFGPKVLSLPHSPPPLHFCSLFFATLGVARTGLLWGPSELRLTASYNRISHDSFWANPSLPVMWKAVNVQSLATAVHINCWNTSRTELKLISEG